MHDFIWRNQSLKHPFVVSVLIAISTFSLVGSVNAERQRLSKPSQREFEVHKSKFVLMPKFSGGVVVGGAAGLIDDYGGGFSDKVFYGVGVTLEYSYRPQHSFGANIELDWYGTQEDIEAVRLLSYTGSWAHHFSQGKHISYFVRSQFGVVTGWRQKGKSTTVKYGSHFVAGLGLGSLYYTAPRISIRSEVFYKRAFAKNEIPNFGRADFDPACIGIDLAIGIAL